MKLIKITIVMLLLTGMTTGMYAQTQEVITTEQQQETSKYTVRRSPVASALLSLVSLGFGGGQYYNKQYLKAGILTGINAGTIIWAIARDEGSGFLAGLEEAVVIALGMLVTLTYSVIDAPISSSVINKRYGLDSKVSFSPSLERNKWDPGVVNLGLKVTLSLD